jgi:hypothetical protein
VIPWRDTVYDLGENLGISQRLLGLFRVSSTSVARIAQTFTVTDPGVKIRTDQREEKPDLGKHSDGVGIISPHCET